jgi:hypothetical protein
METIERATAEGKHYDSRLSARCNALLKTSRLLIHSQRLFIEQNAPVSSETLSHTEHEVLASSFTEIMVKASIIVSTLKTYAK